MASKAKSASALAGPAKWNAAATLADLEEAVDEIDVEIAAAERRKVELEADAGEFLLAGGDVGARARDAYEVGQKIEAFGKARAIVANRLAKAQDVQRGREWSDRSEAARVKAEWLEAAWARFYGACGEVIEASGLIGEIVAEIDEIERPMAAAGWKPGQLVHLLQVRAQAAENLPVLPPGPYSSRRYDADAIEIIAKVAAEVAMARGVHRSAHDIAKAEWDGTFAEIQSIAKVGFDGRTAA